MIGLTIAGVLLALQAASVIAAYKATRTARTPQGAVGWVVFLLSAPHVALPFYLFLGHSRFPGYVSARRSARSVIGALKDYTATHGSERRGRQDREGQAIAAFEGITDLPAVSGNAVDLLIDGDATFDAILSAIRGAKSYVLVEFYILRDDRIGAAFRECLMAKAREGCTVRLLYDAIGSHGLPKSYFETLAEAGVVVRNFHSIRQPRSRLQLNFRNHRKIVIVDGETGFVGGLNVGDEYMGRDPKFGHWRDTHLRLSGPVVAQLQLVFVEDWHWATDEELALNWSPARVEPGRDALVVATGPADAMEAGSLYFCNAINAAQRRIWIASPYFVPDIDIQRALQLAVLRGVEVKILIPDMKDHLLVWLAAFEFVGEALDAGVTVMRYRDGFMHQKVVLVDDRFASVGTINLDNRSCRLNFEVTAVVFDPGFAAEVEAMLAADFARAVPHADRAAELPQLARSVGAPVARLFAPIL